MAQRNDQPGALGQATPIGVAGRRARLLRDSGPADLILRRDPRHLLHAEHCELADGVLTCITARGTRSWPMREIVECRWRDTAAQEQRAA